MVERELDKLAKSINNSFEVNIFQNTRKRAVVDARSLFCYIAYNTYKLTYHAIADYFRRNGKPYDHSTAVHAINQYEIVLKYNPRAEYIMSEILKDTNKDAHTKFLVEEILMNADQEVKDKISKYLNGVYAQTLKQEKSPTSY
jgi:hypothetical protein